MGGVHRLPLTRRTMLRRMGMLTAAAWAVPLTGRVGREAWAQTAGTVLDPAGTTIEAAITTVGDGPYFRLGFGPGWPILVREDLATAQSGRQDRRRALASVVHYTDFQLVDAQSPARVEFLDNTAEGPAATPFGAAFRPQEAVVCHVVEALVRRNRALTMSPVTGRRIDCVVCTGDNIDNAQLNEMEWFRTLMDGGTFAPNSGAVDVFEGVQSFSGLESYRNEYYHPDPFPDPRAPDDYRRLFSFPDYPGMLEAAILDIDAVGLPARWYSAYGNHDYLNQGNAQPNEAFEAIATGSVKVLGPPPGFTGGRFFTGLAEQDPATLAAFGLAPAVPVAADPARTLLSPADYIQAHLDSPATPGPVGHGFTQDNLDSVTLYYAFDVAEGVRGITLDTTAAAASEGAFGVTQLAWLEARLQEVHSRYFDSAGTEMTTGNQDQLVIIFSHHRPGSINPVPYQIKSSGQLEQGMSGAALIEVLHRYPNVILWVNGHSHFNRIEVHEDPAGRTGGFYDITTAAQIDAPQQARILEIVDNADGTLSIFTTVIDHGAPPQTDPTRLDLDGLAAIGRELAFNDFQSDVADAIGTPQDLNTELILGAPFPLSDVGAPAPTPTSTPSPAPTATGTDAPAPTTSPPMPVTGAGLGAAALGAAALGAVIRRRDEKTADRD